MIFYLDCSLGDTEDWCMDIEQSDCYDSRTERTCCKSCEGFQQSNKSKTEIHRQLEHTAELVFSDPIC